MSSSRAESDYWSLGNDQKEIGNIATRYIAGCVKGVASGSGDNIDEKHGR